MSDLTRRSLLTGAAAGLAALGAAACGGPQVTNSPGSTGGGGAATTAKPGGSVASKAAGQITYWSVHPAKSKPVEEELIKRFQEKNPDIKVTLETAGKDYAEVAQKFQAALAAKKVPDVVMLSDVWWFKYFLNKTITPLDDLLKAEKVELDDYQPTLIKDYQYQNKQWAMPFARSTPLFYYNKNVWKEAGLPDRGPKTWEEFDEWGPKIQAKLPAGKFAFTHVRGESYIAWTYQAMIWAFGGQYSKDFDMTLGTPENEAASNWLRKQIFEKKYANVTAKDEAADFTAGTCASVVTSTGGLTGILKDSKGKFEVGTSFLPEQKQFGCPTGGAGLAIPSSIPDENKLAAMRFIKFLGEPDNTAYYSQNVGYMPVRKAAVDGDIMKKVYAEYPQYKTAVEQLAKTKSQDYARVYVPGGDSIIGKGLERIMLKNEDPKIVWPSVQTELETVVKNDVKPKLG